MRLVQIRAGEMNVVAVGGELLARAGKVGSVSRDDRDFRAFARERSCTGEADSLAAARDQDDLTRKTQIHVVLLSVLWCRC